MQPDEFALSLELIRRRLDALAKRHSEELREVVDELRELRQRAAPDLAHHIAQSARDVERRLVT